MTLPTLAKTNTHTYTHAHVHTGAEECNMLFESTYRQIYIGWRAHNDMVLSDGHGSHHIVNVFNVLVALETE